MKKQLYRSKTNRVIGGVAGGLGEYFEIDPIILRILFILVTVLGGSGILIYIIMWIIIPDSPAPFPNNMNATDSDFENTEAEDADYENLEDMNTKEKKTMHRQEHSWGSTQSSLFGGILLITLGCLFLADRFIPRIDFGDLWPVLIIVIGVILVYKGVRENPPTSKEENDG